MIKKPFFTAVMALFAAVMLGLAFSFTPLVISAKQPERSRYAYRPANSGCSETIEEMWTQIATLVAYLPVIPDIADFEFHDIDIVGTGMIWHCWCYSGGCH